MGTPPKRRVQGGRVTAKGTRPVGVAVSQSYSSGKVSPIWVPILMFTLLGAGGVMIILNYLGVVPGDTNNWYLLGGLGLILSGIVTATQLH